MKYSKLIYSYLLSCPPILYAIYAIATKSVTIKIPWYIILVPALIWVSIIYKLRNDVEEDFMIKRKYSSKMEFLNTAPVVILVIGLILVALLWAEESNPSIAGVYYYYRYY